MFSRLALFLCAAAPAAARTLTSMKAGYTIIEKEAANAGYGLPGCDKDTFIRYSLLFCAGSADVKPLKDSFFMRLEPDVKGFKKEINKELGFKKWKMDTVTSNSFSVCHNSLGEFAPENNACNYEFKEEGPDGTRVKAATSAAELFGAN